MKIKGLYEGLVVFLSYALLFIAMSFPLVLDFNSSIIGSGPDPYQYIWNADTFARSLWSGENPFYTDRVAYPFGLSLVMHTYTPIIGMVNLVLANPYLSCNLVLLFSIGVGGLGAYLFAKDFMDSKALAFASGLCFAFSPYISSHLLEHYHLILIAPVPFYFRSLLKLNLKQRIWGQLNIKHLAILSLCFLLCLLSDYYTTFFLIFGTLFFLIFKLIEHLSIKRWVLFLSLLVLWICSHILVEYFYTHQWDDKGAFYNTADLISFFIPAQNSFIYSFDIFEFMRRELNYKGPNEQVMFLGYFTIIALLITPKAKRSAELQAMRFLSLFFVFLCLPKLQILGASITYTPTSWFHYLPFLNNIRNPSRFVQMLYLLLPIMAFFHLDRFLTRKRLQAVSLLVPAIILLEFFPSPYPLIKQSDAGEYASVLAMDEQVEVIWHIPSGLGDGFMEVGRFDPQLLQDQLIHTKKQLGAYISRIKQSDFERFEKEEVFEAAYNAQLQSPMPVLDQAVIAEFLKVYKVDVILLDMEQGESGDLGEFVEKQFSEFTVEIKEIGNKQLYYLERYSSR